MPWIAATRTISGNRWNLQAGDATVTPQVITAVASVPTPAYTGQLLVNTVNAVASVGVVGQLTYVGSGAAAVDTQTLSVPAPAGLAVGDRELMFHHWNRGRTAPSAPGATTGWSLLITEQTQGNERFQVWTRIVPSGETTQDTTLAPSNFCEQRAVRVAWRSKAGASVDFSSVDTSQTNGTTISTDAASSGAGTLVIGVTAEYNLSSDSWTPDSALTERYNSGYTSGIPRIWVGEEVFSGGTTTSRTFTTDVSGRDMFTATIRLYVTLIAVSTVNASTTISGTVVSPDANISPSTVAAVASMGAPSLAAEAAPAVVASTATVGAPTVSGDANYAATTVAATASVGSVTFTSDVLITPTVVAAAASVPAPSVVTAGNATVSVATVAATATVGTITFTSSSTVISTAVDGAASVGTATVTASVFITPTTVSATTAVGAPTVTSSANVSVASVTGLATVGSATVTINALVSATSVDGVASVGSALVIDALITGSATFTFQACAVEPGIYDSILTTGAATLTLTAQAVDSVDERIVLVGDAPTLSGTRFGADEAGAYKSRSFAI